MDAELLKERAWFCDGHHKNAESAKDIADPGCSRTAMHPNIQFASASGRF
jgi:hypothetical protein